MKTKFYPQFAQIKVHMSWINKDSLKLIETEVAKEFAAKNGLLVSGDLEGANFFNSDVLIRMYEERSFLYADYFDLKRYRWCRELENQLIGSGMVSVDDARRMYESAKLYQKSAPLHTGSMTNFVYYLAMIETYMQDFLEGDFRRYEKFFRVVGSQQK